MSCTDDAADDTASRRATAAARAVGRARAVEGVRRAAGARRVRVRHVPDRHPARPRGAHGETSYPADGHRPHRRRQLAGSVRVVGDRGRHDRGARRDQRRAAVDRRVAADRRRHAPAARHVPELRLGLVPGHLRDQRAGVARCHASTPTTARSTSSAITGAVDRRQRRRLDRDGVDCPDRSAPPTTTAASRAPACARRPSRRHRRRARRAGRSSPRRRASWPRRTTARSRSSFPTTAPPTASTMHTDDGSQNRASPARRSRQPTARSSCAPTTAASPPAPAETSQAFGARMAGFSRSESASLHAVGGRDGDTDRPVDGGVLLVVRAAPRPRRAGR